VKERVPLAGKGASLDEARCPGWRLMREEKFINLMMSTVESSKLSIKGNFINISLI
jgi:hypothetical protein